MKGPAGVTRGIVALPSLRLFTFGPPTDPSNIWPTHHSDEIRELVTYYYNMMEKAEHVLYRSLSKVLGLADELAISRAVGTHRGLLSFNYGINHHTHVRQRTPGHTDWGTITILYPQPGLLVLPAGSPEYRSVRVSEHGVFVVNIGDSLERYTGGKLVSSIHSVRRWQDEERLSIPYFGGQALDLRNDVKIDLLLPQSDSHVSYIPVSHKDFIARNWAEFRKLKETSM